MWDTGVPVVDKGEITKIFICIAYIVLLELPWPSGYEL